MPGNATGKSLQAHILDLGTELRIAGVSAEPVVEYLPSFGPFWLPAAVLCKSLDGVVGYVPTAQMIVEGGYEVEDFQAAFGLAGRFSPNPTGYYKAGLLRPLAA